MRWCFAASTAIQSFNPNLKVLFVTYWINLHSTSHGSFRSDLFHKAFLGRSLRSGIPLVITNQINWSGSLSDTSQFVPREMHWVSSTAHFLIFLNIASQTKARKDEDGLRSMNSLVANDVGPRLKWWCSTGT